MWHKIENLVIALKRETTGSRLGYGRCRGGLGVEVKGVARKEGVGMGKGIEGRVGEGKGVEDKEG